MSQPLAVTLLASAAQTASGNGTSFDLSTLDGKIRAILDLTFKVTAVTGTFAAGQGLTASIQTSPDGVAWQTLGSFALTTTTGYQRQRFGTVQRYARVTWTIAGTTPSFTFDCSGMSHVTYADPDDFSVYGLPAAMTAKFTTDAICAALLAGSSDCDGYIPKRYLLPLIGPYPEVLKQRVCDLAAMTVTQVRGFKPDGGTDRLIVSRWQAAMSWLQSVAKGLIEPQWVDGSPAADEGAPVIDSDDPMWPTVELTATFVDPTDPTTW